MIPDSIKARYGSAYNPRAGEAETGKTRAPWPASLLEVARPTSQ